MHIGRQADRQDRPIVNRDGVWVEASARLFFSLPVSQSCQLARQGAPRLHRDKEIKELVDSSTYSSPALD